MEVAGPVGSGAAGRAASDRSPGAASAGVFDYALWERRLAELRQGYGAAEPFPHVVLDDFLRPAAAEAALADFPPPHGAAEWIHYAHVNERKLGRSDRRLIPPRILAVIDELSSPRFLRFLAELTGISGLFADPTLEGGGLHQIPRGGWLNVHADFTVHPHHRDWQRRVNLLVYLNRDWQDAYGGHLELWDRAVRRCVRRIAPVFNRCVIFNTGPESFHGHPDPLACPEGLTRKSIALYYFTRGGRARVRATAYRPRPGDPPVRRAAIWLDGALVRTYDLAKRRLGLSDALVSRLLRQLWGSR